MVISSSVKTSSRPIHSEAEIRDAAEHLDFRAILPSGLPEGTKPIRLYTAGTSLLAVTYDLPGAERRSHHLLWIFLANPNTMASPYSRPAAYQLRTGHAMSMDLWRTGPEAVIVVSNGLTASELARIKRAMQ